MSRESQKVWKMDNNDDREGINGDVMLLQWQFNLQIQQINTNEVVRCNKGIGLIHMMS